MTERRNDDPLLRETIVRLEAHETADALMFKQINNHMEKIEASIGKLFSRFWAAAISVIMLLLMISGYLYIESSKTNKEFLLEMAKIVAERSK